MLRMLDVENLPNRFCNLDEVGLGLDPKVLKCLYHRGTKNAQFLVPTEGKSMFTVLFCGNTSGEYVPSYAVYKGKENHIVDSWTVGGSDQCTFNITKSGWMEDYVFKAWFIQVFLKHLETIPKPIILFFFIDMDRI